MASIAIQHLTQVLTLTIEGDLTKPEVVEAMMANYPSAKRKNKLWDLARANIRNLTEADWAGIASVAAAFGDASAETRTALVAGDIESFATLSRYLVKTSIARVRVEYRIFRGVEEAMKWVNPGPTD